MVEVKVFIFNPFYENTYILYDKSGECVIIDPGCEDIYEERKLSTFIESHNLKPVRLLNTHCHIDHIFGNRFVSEKYGLPLEANVEDSYNIEAADVYAEQFGFQPPKSPQIERDLKEGNVIRFGISELQVIEVPGHSAGHIVFYCKDQDFVVGGDVLFRESIGRTDLPGGNHTQLIRSINEKIMTLPGNTRIYSGHGPLTTLDHEKNNNPFLNDTGGNF